MAAPGWSTGRKKCKKGGIETMKKAIMMLVTAVFISWAPSSAWGEITVSTEMQEKIASVLRNPKQVYDLDQSETEAILRRIDRWFEKHLSLEKVRRTEDKTSGRTVYQVPLEPVPSSPEAREKVPYSWYIKEPQKRAFVKEVRRASSIVLPDEEVVSIGTDFIVRNGFTKRTENDRMITARISARKKKEVKMDGTESVPQVLFQRVQFKREFFGLGVLNSKQMVDVRGENREILAYRHRMWSAVDESTGRATTYRTQAEIDSFLNTLFRQQGVRYIVTDVKSYYYQTGKQLVPVLRVETKREREPSGITPIEEVVIIPLPREISLEPPQKPGRLPKKQAR
jgi:hypothetical protein